MSLVRSTVPGFGDGQDDDVRRILAGLDPNSQAQVLTPEITRDRHARGAATGWAVTRPLEVTDTRTDGGTLLRVYRSPSSCGVTVMVHGGGWVTGTLDTYDDLARLIADRADTMVVSVGYGLAPEHPMSEQLDEVYDACQWAAARSDGKISLFGDSAGAYLCARTAVRLARDREGLLRRLALLYPVISPSPVTDSAIRYATGYRLEMRVHQWNWEQAMPDAGDRMDLIVDAVSGLLPPTLVIVGGLDPLHDGGVAYAEALGAAGVDVRLVDFVDQIHGFTRIPSIRQHADSVDLIAEHLRM